MKTITKMFLLASMFGSSAAIACTDFSGTYSNDDGVYSKMVIIQTGCDSLSANYKILQSDYKVSLDFLKSPKTDKISVEEASYDSYNTTALGDMYFSTSSLTCSYYGKKEVTCANSTSLYQKLPNGDIEEKVTTTSSAVDEVLKHTLTWKKVE